MYTLDTNAIIYYLKADKVVVSFLDDILKRDVPIYISSITEAELFSYSDLEAQEIVQIESILETLSIISIDSRIARIAGSIRAKNRTGLADSIIAATALFTGTSLLTRNVRDFRKVPHLSTTGI
jgi:predicted nucleic acid-binding protein